MMSSTRPTLEAKSSYGCKNRRGPSGVVSGSREDEEPFNQVAGTVPRDHRPDWPPMRHAAPEARSRKIFESIDPFYASLGRGGIRGQDSDVERRKTAAPAARESP